MNSEKECIKCGLLKASDNFSLNKRYKKDGRNPICKNCEALRVRKWRNSSEGKKVSQKSTKRTAQLSSLYKEYYEASETGNTTTSIMKRIESLKRR